jgi:glycosyltransferase involved in cell wall biosynthesis/polysaccharide pyruvyl transferase WcaK-like protein
MTIFLLIDRLDIGGAETHVALLARSLAARGNRVTVVSAGGVLEAGLSGDGVRIAHLDGRFVRSFAANTVRLARLVRKEQPDVIHAHTRRTALLLWVTQGLIHLAPSRFLTKPTALWEGYCHRALWRVCRPIGVVTAHARFRPRYRRLSYWGDATVAVSEDLAEHLARAFGVRRRVTVIPNGIETARVSRAGEREDAVGVVFVSRLDRDCSAVAFALLDLAPRLVRAAAEQGKRLTVTLVGGGACYDALARRAQTLDGVRAVGALADVTPCLAASDVFVSVSRAALEAVAAGCAVVLAGNEGYGGVLCEENLDHFSASNFCCRGEKGLDPERLYADVRSLVLASREQRARLVAPLRSRVVEAYGASRMAARTEALYTRTLVCRRRLRVLVAGYAGCGNLGDDAILRCLVARLDGRVAPPRLAGAGRQEGAERVAGRAVCCRPPRGVLLRPRRCFLVGGKDRSTLATRAPRPRLALTALVGGEAVVGAPFGIPTRDRRRPMGALWRCDALVLGGGSLLQNRSTHGGRSLAYYLSLPWLARRLGRPCHVVANGLGPLTGARAARAVGRLLDRAASVSLRDRASLALARSLGVRSVTYEEDPVRCRRWPRGCGGWAAAWRRWRLPQPQGRYVCVVPRACDPTEAVSRRLAELRERGFALVLLTFDRRHDRGICRELSTRFPDALLLPPLDERLVLQLLRGAQGLLSSRLHALILAETVGTPCALLARQEDPKFDAWGEEL